jgi:peptidyl-prolyl cis-trans isomerase B (cyclophilin B)
VTSRKRLASLAIVPILAVLAAGCGSSGSKDDTTTTGGSSSTSPKAAACTYTSDGSQPAKPATAPPGTPTVTTVTSATIDTNRGAIKVTLDGDKTPCTVNSFLSLAKQGYFDNTKCHRLTTQGIYVLQCGDPSGTGGGGPGYKFADELLKNDSRIAPCQGSGTQQVCNYAAGTLAMANAGPGTNGSQFFLVYGDSPLAPAYTVFGHMDASGLKVVKAIAKDGIGAATPGMGAGDGAPKKPVIITSVK